LEREHELARLHEAQRERVGELERAHQALRENQEKLLVSQRMATLGRLTAGMAHEMNTPLAAVRAALGELMELVSEYRASIDSPEVTPSDHREIAKEMEGGGEARGQRGAARCGFRAWHQGRDARPLEQGVSPLRSGPRDRRNAPPLEPRRAARAHCTVTFVPERSSLDLFGSPSRLSQVVTNLVTNALDASAEKGGGPVELLLGSCDDGLELRVSDRGTGISPEAIGKIFDPMYTSKPFGVGTGLGLTIVHDIMTGDFNGTIEVESVVGLGTTFVLTFRRGVDGESDASGGPDDASG